MSNKNIALLTKIVRVTKYVCVGGGFIIMHWTLKTCWVLMRANKCMLSKQTSRTSRKVPSLKAVTARALQYFAF